MTKERLENMDDKDRKNFLVPEQEPYICGNCGIEIMGGRYNNHCPQCLWSQHVDDKIPGDRSSDCQGMMKPVGVFQKKGKWRIKQECTKCEHTFIIDSSPEDDFSIIIELSKTPLR